MRPARWAYSALLAALMLLAGGARAQSVASPQRFALEIKFGPYVPNLDASKGLDGRTPFSDLFGNASDPKGAPPSRGLLTLGEFDWQFFKRFGILAVGLSAGYYSNSAQAFVRFGNPPTNACQVEDDGHGNRKYTRVGADPMNPGVAVPVSYASCLSGDQYTLNVVPLSLLAVYRFDVLDKRFRIPLIPYFKVGLAYYIWWFGSSSAYVAPFTPKDDKGNPLMQTADSSGASLGVVLHPGLAIDLSAIDRHSAVAIDREIGLNRVTAFIELNAAFVNGFGAAHKLDLSDLTFNAGMGFEF